MANISVQSDDKNNFRGLTAAPAIIAQGTKIVISVSDESRIFFEQGNPTLFPKNSSDLYSGGGSVFIDFQTGFITGKDEASSNFTPQIPSSGSYIAFTAAINRDSELVFFKGIQGTLNQVQSGVLSGSSNYLGDQPINTLKLFTVILTSTNGTIISDISNSLVFSYLNSLNINVPASRVNYTGLSLNSVYDGGSTFTLDSETIIREPFLTDVFSGDSEYKTSRTSVKVGDSIIIERWLNGNLEVSPVTVTGVTNGTYNDTVSFTPALTKPHILELRPQAKVVNPPVYNLPRALYQKNRRMLFDSGWVEVSLGATSTFQTSYQNWLPDPISSIPMVVWASTKNSSDVVVLSDPFLSGSTRVGVQVTLNNSVVRYKIGTGGVFYNLDSSQMVTTGFIRIFLREV